MKKIALILAALGFSNASFAGSCEGNNWDYLGTYIVASDYKTLNPIMPKTLVERVVTDVGPVQAERTNCHSAIIIVDKTMISVRGYAKVAVKGKAFCLGATPSGEAKSQEPEAKATLTWCDEEFDPAVLKNQLIVFLSRAAWNP